MKKNVIPLFLCLLFCSLLLHAQEPVLNQRIAQAKWCGSMQLTRQYTKTAAYKQDMATGKMLSCAFLEQCYADPADDPNAPHDCSFTAPACNFKIPVQYHIFGPNAPANIGTTIDQEMDALNVLFAPIGVEFFECAPRNNVADPTGIWDIAADDDLQGGTTTTANDSPNLINIYLVDGFSNGICGYAYLPTSMNAGLNHMVYSYQNAGCGFGNARTSGHEIGHFLGLYHPHTDDDPNTGVVEPQEAASTTSDPNVYCQDCNVANPTGDCIFDTNPDPLLNAGTCVDANDPSCSNPCVTGVCSTCYVDVCNGCSYTGPAGYAPNLDNIMNYNPWSSCGGTVFTPCQQAKMFDLLNTCKGTTLCCMPDPIDPADPAAICSDAGAAALTNLVTTTTTGTPFNAECFYWWDQATGGTPIANGTSFTPPIAIDGSGCMAPGTYDYWVSNANIYDNGTCESNRMMFTITVTPCGTCAGALACPTANNASGNVDICSGGLVSAADITVATVNMDPDNTAGNVVYAFNETTAGDPTTGTPFVLGTTALANTTCSPTMTTVNAYIECDNDGNAGVDSHVAASSFTITVYPTLSIMITDNGTTCGTPSASLMDATSVVCATQTKSAVCADNNDSFAYDFTTNAADDGYDGTWMPSAPAACMPAASNTINCSGCGLACPTANNAAGSVDICSGGTVATTDITEATINMDPDNTAGSVVYAFNETTAGDPTTGTPFVLGTTTLTNMTCNPTMTTVNAYIECDNDGNAGVDSHVAAGSFMVTVYPSVSINITDDGTTCGTPSVQLLDATGTVCATQTKSAVCADNNDSFAYDFTTNAADDGHDGTWIPNAPAACMPTVIGTINCSNCVVPCTAMAPEPTITNTLCPDGISMGAPYVLTETGGSNAADEITEYILLDGPSGNILDVVPTLADAEIYINGLADGTVVCVQAMTHRPAELDALIAALDTELFNQVGINLCTLLGPPCPNLGTLEAFYDAILPVLGGATFDVATVEILITGDLNPLGFPIILTVPPFCYDLSMEACITVSSCPSCPILLSVIGSDDVCANGATELAAWQASLPVNPAGTGSAVTTGPLYSSVAIGASGFPMAVGNAVHDGSNCAIETESYFAYYECDLNGDGFTGGADDSYLDGGSYTLTIHPDISQQANVINGDGTCGPSITLECGNYMIVNSLDGNGATPDFSNVTGTGTVTFTVSIAGAPAGTNCASFDYTATYNCCDAEAGVATTTLDCPGDDLVVDVNQNQTGANYVTILIITDLNGNILAIYAFATASVSVPDSDLQNLGVGQNYNIYIYNEDITAAPFPNPTLATNVNDIGIVASGCYDLSLPTSVFVPAPIAVDCDAEANSGLNGGVSPFYFNIHNICVSGGTPPYNYQWNTQGFVRNGVIGTGQIRILYADNAQWSVTVTDNNACSDTSWEFSNISNLLNIHSYAVSPASPFGGCSNGSIAIEVYGGTPPYTYNWSTPFNWTGTVTTSGANNEMATLNNAVRGWYGVTVTDAVGDETGGWYWMPCTLPGRGKVGGLIDNTGLIAFPNPFSDYTQVNFSVAENVQAEVALFSIDGRQLEVLFDGQMEANQTYEALVNGDQLAEGMYVLRLTTETGLVQYQKLVVAK